MADPWYASLARTASGGLGSLVQIARDVLKNEATASQRAFFAVAAVAVVDLVAIVAMAFRNDPPLYLISALGILCVTLVVLVVLRPTAEEKVLPPDVAALQKEVDLKARALAELNGSAARTAGELNQVRAELEASQGSLARSAEEKGRLAEDLAEVTTRVHELVNRFVESPNLPAIRSMTHLLIINDDGLLRYSRKSELVPHDRQLFLIDEIVADVGVEGMGGIKLQVDVADPAHPDLKHKVIVLPAINEPTNKKFAYFFLPAIEAGVQRVCHVRWQWPQIFKKLMDQRTDEWRHEVRSWEAVPTVTWEFHFQHSIGPVSIECIDGCNGHHVELPDPDEHGYRVHRCVWKNVAPKTELAVRLRRI